MRKRQEIKEREVIKEITDALIGIFRSGMWNARERRKYGRRCGFLFHKKGRGDLMLVLSSHENNGGSSKMINGAEKGKSYRSEGGLLLLLLSAEKKSE